MQTTREWSSIGGLLEVTIVPSPDRERNTRTAVKRYAWIAVLTALLLAPLPAYAGRINLAWDPSSSPNVAGYIVSYGTVPGVYTQSVDVGSRTSWVLSSLTNGLRHYFIVRAYTNEFVYSDPSNEASGIPANVAPLVVNPGDVSVRAGPFSMFILATDADADVLTYGAAGLPSGLTIDSTSGLISGDLGPASAGTHSVTLTASDGAAVGSTMFVLTVTVNRAPTLSVAATLNNAEGDVVSLRLVGSDPDGDALTYGASGLPPGLALDAASGLVSGTLPFSASGVYSTTFVVSDPETSSQAVATWTVTNTNRSPVVSAPGPQQAYQGVGVALALTATDADADALTWSATNLPPGIAVDPVTGVLSGIPTTLGTYTVSVIVSDGSATGQASFAWTVASPLPSGVTPFGPTGTIASVTPTFSWSADPLATSYLVSISDATSASATETSYTPTEAGCAGGAGPCSAVAPRPLAAGRVTWKVLASNTYGDGPWSSTTTVVVDLADPSMPMPVPQAPSGSVGTRTPTYVWRLVSGAAWYQLSITDALASTTELWYTPAEACARATCDVTPNMLLPLGTSTWRIRAWSTSGAGEWSAPMVFQPSGSAPGKATLISPAGPVTTATPSFTWNAVPGVSDYLVRVIDRDNVRLDRWYRPSEAGCGSGSGTCTVSPGVAIKPGRAAWRVQTWNGSVRGPWSDTRRFTVEVADPGIPAPQPLRPTGSVNSTPVVFSWTSVAGALSYRLSVRNNGGPERLWWFSSSAAGCDADAQCDATPVAALRNGTTEWRIQAWSANGYGSWSSAVPLTVDIQAPLAPVPTSPIGPASPTAAFVWQASARATLYYLAVVDSSGARVNRWLSAADAGCPAGTGTCTYNTGLTLGSGAGAWRVVAWNPGGYSPWSPRTGFVIP